MRNAFCLIVMLLFVVIAAPSQIRAAVQVGPFTFGVNCLVAVPSCALGCTNISVQLLALTGKALSFTLATGKKFQTYGVNTSSMSPEPGQLYITPGQIATLYLYRDPSGK